MENKSLEHIVLDSLFVILYNLHFDSTFCLLACAWFRRSVNSAWPLPSLKSCGLQALRANADIQLLIYRSDPNIPDIGEIKAVSRYCVSYAGKRYKTTRQEINSMQDIIFR